jgi:conjugal transfer mating pair stabilization protein TraG
MADPTNDGSDQTQPDPSVASVLGAASAPEPAPSTAGGQPLDPNDRDMLIKTVYGEASNQPVLGQAGIVHAILNRVAAGGYSGGAPNTIANVVTAPAAGENPAHGFKEFSPWNAPGVPESNPVAQHLSPNNSDPRLANAYRNIGDLVDKVYAGLIPDPTGGATHYYGFMKVPPKWAAPLAAQNRVKIGDQTFVGGSTGPGQALPSQIVGGYADMGAQGS